mgnify:CR=1 FL=1
MNGEHKHLALKCLEGMIHVLDVRHPRRRPDGGSLRSTENDLHH